jgi:hypothetical protein
MNQITMNQTPADLNETECAVLNACAMQIVYETSCEFGYADDVKIEGMTKHQIAGYVSQLCQKGYIDIEPDSKQMMLRDKAAVLYDRHFETMADIMGV